MDKVKPLIVGVSSNCVTMAEEQFIKRHNPWGFILFSRNIAGADDVKKLTSTLRQLTGRAAPIFVDQEGGRVQRLRGALAPDYPAAGKIGEIFLLNQQKATRAAWLMSRLHAFDLARLGIDGNCLPVLDIPVAGANRIISDRAYDGDPLSVTALGRAAAQGLVDGGIMPVMKHIPGHGRALADTHFAIAHVEAPLDDLKKQDFAPFKALADLPIAMTAHVIYDAIDPENAATLSPKVVGDIIRRYIGFDGLLLTDDLSMQALSGPIDRRANAALDAGCDIILHCNSKLNEMETIAQNIGYLSDQSLQRAINAQHYPRSVLSDNHEEAALREEFKRLMKG